MHRLAPLAVIVVALVGCDPAVQSRYQPTSVDEVFGALPRVSGVEAAMFELPAAPPAIDTIDLPKRACRPPGVTQKPTDMVGLQESRYHLRTVEPTLMVASSEPPMRSPPPSPAYRIASWDQHQEVGAKESIATPIEPSTLQPGRSIQRNEPILYGAYRRDVYSWCNDAANTR